MTSTDLMKHWVDSAERDYTSMVNIYASGQYNWALFIGHLVIEKLLKGLYAKLNEQEPYAPKTHNLLTLAQKCKLVLSESQVEALSRITKFNMSARYGSGKNDFYALCTPAYAEEQIDLIQELRLWLKEKLV